MKNFIVLIFCAMPVFCYAADCSKIEHPVTCWSTVALTKVIVAEPPEASGFKKATVKVAFFAGSQVCATMIEPQAGEGRVRKN